MENEINRSKNNKILLIVLIVFLACTLATIDRYGKLFVKSMDKNAIVFETMCIDITRSIIRKRLFKKRFGYCPYCRRVLKNGYCKKCEDYFF